jgi:hypothetical protein
MKSIVLLLPLSFYLLISIAEGRQTIGWWTVDGRGGISTGGVYTVSGSWLPLPNTNSEHKSYEFTEDHGNEDSVLYVRRVVQCNVAVRSREGSRY